MIKFNKYYVTNGSVKARVYYSTYADGSVVMYEKDYTSQLRKIFTDEFKNETDLMADYFETDSVKISPNHPLYAAALARHNQNKAA